MLFLSNHHNFPTFREVAGPICTNRPDYLKASVVEQLYYLQTISDETIQLKGKNYPMQKAV